jgi:antirestriction protein ArdC
MKKSMNEEIAEQLIAALEAGRSPFQQAGFKMPVNPTTGRHYRGMTALQLALTEKADPRWMTLRQASNAKWKVEKGSKGTLINFAKTQDRVTLLDENGERQVNSKGKTKTQLIKLDKPVMTNAFVFNADQIEDIPTLAEFLEERAARRPESGAERLATIAAKAEEQVPNLKVAELPYMALINELAVYSGNALTEGVAGNPVAEEMRTAMASLIVAETLGFDAELDPRVDLDEWISELRENPSMLEGIVTQAQYIADDILKLEPKREQQQGNKADRALQVGDVIPYNNTEYEVTGKLKKNALQVLEKESGNKFRVSPGDGVYNSLLQAKREMVKQPEQNQGQEQEQNQEQSHDLGEGVDEDHSMQEEHDLEEQYEHMLDEGVNRDRPGEELVLNQEASETKSTGRRGGR